MFRLRLHPSRQPAPVRRPHLIMEQAAGGMVASPRIAHLDVINTDDRGIGELVVTTLTNDYMPLIRYKIGDLMRLKTTDYGPAYEMHGRAKDALTNGRGGRVTVRQLDACFAGAEGIAHYQLRHGGGYKLFCIGENGAISESVLHGVKERVEALLGAGLEIHLVDYIPCEASGKYRLIQP